MLEVELPDVADRRGARGASRTATASPPWPRSTHVLRPASIVVDRRVAASRHRRRRGAAQPAGRRLRRAAVRGPPARPSEIERRRARTRRSPTCPSRSSWRSSPCPPHAVVDVARDCGDAGVRALVVLSAGFAEVGERRARAASASCWPSAAAAGMRLVGPNCLGVLNTDPASRSTRPSRRAPRRRAASRSPRRAGRSGSRRSPRPRAPRPRALLVRLDRRQGRPLGQRLPALLGAGRATRTSILLYLESFGNPRRFGRIARPVARRKPIVAVKSGRSAGRRARRRLAHRRAGRRVRRDRRRAVRARRRDPHRHDRRDARRRRAARRASRCPRGDRVAIVTNAGGPGIAVRGRLRRRRAARRAAAPTRAAARCAPRCRREAVGRQPGRHDRLGLAPRTIARAIELRSPTTRRSTRSSSIFVPPLVTRAADVADAIARREPRPPRRRKPLLARLHGRRPTPRRRAARPTGRAGCTPRRRRRRARSATSSATRAVARAAPDRAAGRSPASTPTAARRSSPRARRGAAAGSRPADVERAPARVRASRSSPRAVARSPAAAGRAAAELGGPVALKVVAPGLVHKSDAGGGAARRSRGADAVARAARAMAPRSCAARATRSTASSCSAMAPAGVELIVGVVGDPDFGPRRRRRRRRPRGRAARATSQVRLAPLGRARRARRCCARCAPSRCSTATAARPRADVAAVEDVLLRMSALAAAHPEIAELDCNP